MTGSERIFRAMLLAYPAEHRREYGDPMVQLFRDRMHRDGGGMGTVQVWTDVGLDLAGSAFVERMETAMNLQTWTSRWWEASVVGLAAYISLLLILDGYSNVSGWALVVLSAAVLLISGLALRTVWRVGGSALVIAGSLLAALPWWLILNVVLAFVIIFGGFASGKIGPDPAKVTEAAP